MQKKALILFLLFAQFVNAQLKYDSLKYKDSLSIAVCHFMNYEYKESLRISNSVLAASTINNDHNLCAMKYNVVGLTFEEISPGNEALNYFEKGLNHAELAKNDTIKTWIYNSLGNYYMYNGIDSKKGLDFYIKSVELSKNLGINNEQTLLDRLNLVIAFFDNNNHETAYDYLIKIKSDLKKFKKRDAYILFYSLMGQYYEYKDNLNLAETNYLKAIDYTKNADISMFTKSIVKIYESTSKIYKKQNNFEKAYLYLGQADSINKLILVKEEKNGLDAVTDNVNSSEALRQKEQLLAEAKLQKEKDRNKNLIIILITFSLISVGGYLLYVIRFNESKKEINNVLKKANDDLTIAKNQAEQASNFKTKFISTISHEIRTPLYGIVGITDIIFAERKENGLEGSTKHLDALQFSANYLLSLVNDVLNLYKIEEQKLTLNNAPFILKKEMDTVKESLSIMAKKYNNEFTINIADDVPEFLNSDKIRISQIIINLISNSFKFTHNGEVSLTIEISKKTTNNCNLILRVKDNGVGIPKESQELIFEKFVQLDRREDDYQGTGLGLSIVKNLVSLFNGTISLYSQVNKGTTFTIELPVEIISTMPQEVKLQPVIKKDQLDILMVEDNKINQMVTKKMVENMGYTCEVIDNGFDALELLKTKTFDLILMDINMPQINGFETTVLIRNEGVETPIFALTAFDKSEVEEDALKTGMNAILTKPVKSEDLLNFIQVNY